MPRNVEVDIPIKVNGKRHPSGHVHDFIGQALYEGLKRRGQARVVNRSEKPNSSLDDMTVAELKEVAKERGLTGYSTMRKKELKEALTTKELKEEYQTK